MNNDGYNRPVLVLNAGSLLGAMGKAMQEMRIALCNVSNQRIISPDIEKLYADKVVEILTKHQKDIVPGDLVRSEWQRINTGD